MKKLTAFFAFLVFVGLQLTQAQTQTITGTVTGSDDGSALPGVTVVVKGNIQYGTVTDFDGKYTLNAPADATVLVFSFVGMKTQDVSIDGRSEIDVVLEPDVFGLDEVVVSGVASGTPKKKLSVSVATVSEKELKEVPATSAATALQGKVAGVTVVQATGTPGSAASIRLRGATQFRGSSAPLIIVDGVQLEGTLADINVDDIATMEVVKGAAASALYGSRAGNGVIVISTKRGKGLAKNETVVTYRGEYGKSDIAHLMDVSTHHFYKLKDDWASENRYTKYAGTVIYGDSANHTNTDSIGILLAGSRQIDDDHYMDNPFGVVHNHLKEFYTGGDFYTNYISVQSNLEKTNFMISYENSEQQGVVFDAGGYNRQNFRVNIDHRFSDKFSFNTSNLIISTKTDNSNLDFFSLMQLQPDMNLNAANPDGTPYRLKVDQFGTTTNPLYPIANTDDYTYRFRLLSSYKFAYNPTPYLKFDVQYSFEKQDINRNRYQHVGYLTLGSYESGGNKGYMRKWWSNEFAQTFMATANFNKQFGDITTKAKLSYLFEQDQWKGFNTWGYDFAVRNIPDFSAIDQDKVGNASNTGEWVAENIFGILDIDYKAKYIGSFLYRYDGASQFGAEQRWHPYFRVSGAYRITEDVTIPGFDELKIRAAYGTSGSRPPWDAQYETYNLSGGNVTKNTLGNNELKPSLIKEIEVGLNAEFLKKFDFEIVYSKTDAEDQFWPVPLPASAGYKTQWQNMGTLSSKSLEATLNARLVSTSSFNWSVNLNFDRIRQWVSKLDVPPFTMGARGNSTSPGTYRIEEGGVFGMLYGERFLRSLSDLPAGEDANDYTINSDGYVIPIGTEGTRFETIVSDKDADGKPVIQNIGDANPDFHVNFTNTITVKGFTLYVLLDWKQGGDIYNLTNQWMYRDMRSADQDVYGLPANQKKAYDYYQSLYNVAAPSSHFVYDGTYVKVREASIYYTIDKQFFNFFKHLRIGVQGRNLFTFTNYKGFDPEIGSTEGSGDATIQAWDEFRYPNFRTVTGSIEFKF
ncbi:MAG: SusC/RagA family TonB-linked outer membrane protein [Chlorobi bacterium]|nr:SusC/RagA family TonB-linked outer membrane protein [Chlorobiota bacterium]